MTGRGLRARAPVDYSKTATMEPAWLKSINHPKSQTPKKRVQKKTVSSQSPGEKENSAVKKNAPKSSKQAKSKSEAKEKPVAVIDKKSKTKKASPKEDKPAAQPARGRNAGLTVLPIGDRKAKTPQVAGLRKPSLDAAKPVPLPKAPPAPKNIPGLPGVIQKNTKEPAASKSGAARPSSGKRKAPAATEITPTPAKQATSRSFAPPAAEPEPSYPQQRSAKRSRQSRPAAAAAAAPRVPKAAAVVNLPPSPEPFSFSPLPASTGLEKQLEESRRNFAALQAVYQELQEENTALKAASIREQVEEVFNQHTERVLEHGERASDLAAHWRQEAERLATLLDESGVEQMRAENRSLRAELATARQALLDMEVEKTEKDKTIVELQNRNAHLEKYARRKPAMVNRCVGTDAGVQMMQARGMVPEGAAGSSLYHAMHSNNTSAMPGAAFGAQHAQQGLGVDAPYPLVGQRTVPHAATVRYPSGSDMNIASNQQAVMQQQQQQPGGINTAESIQGGQQRQSMRGRRASGPVNLQPLPGQTAADVSRQIQFYSNSLSAVPEEAEEEAQAAAVAAPQQQHMVVDEELSLSIPQNQRLPSASAAAATGPHPPSPMLSCDAAALQALNMDYKTLSGGKFRYTHHPTGFQFELGLAPDPDDGQIVLHYQPVVLGLAEAALRELALDDEGWAPESQREQLTATILNALGKAKMQFAAQGGM